MSEQVPEESASKVYTLRTFIILAAAQGALQGINIFASIEYIRDLIEYNSTKKIEMVNT